MKVFVTGGTGFLASYLIPALQQRGDTVDILALPGEDVAGLESQGVGVMRGDVRHADSLANAMEGVDSVFHLAGLMGVWRPPNDYYAVNVTGTENVCRAALWAGVNRLVHISSWTVYGMNLGPGVDEQTPLTPLHEPYAYTKAQGDKVVQRLIAEEGLPAVIIRPGTIFGAGDRLNFGRIAQRLGDRRWITVGSGRNALPLVYVTDVVRGLLLAHDSEAAVGQAYNIGNDEPLRQNEAWQAIAEDIGAPRPRIHVPYRLLCAVAYAAERVAARHDYGSEPLITRHGVMLFGGDNRHSIEKARRDLGYVPQVALREGIRLAAAWYQGEARTRRSAVREAAVPA
jgi:nucleoside-diphosphate-sugar epimerase